MKWGKVVAEGLLIGTIGWYFPMVFSGNGIAKGNSYAWPSEQECKDNYGAMVVMMSKILDPASVEWSAMQCVETPVVQATEPQPPKTP